MIRRERNRLLSHSFQSENMISEIIPDRGGQLFSHMLTRYHSWLDMIHHNLLLGGHNKPTRHYTNNFMLLLDTLLEVMLRPNFEFEF